MANNVIVRFPSGNEVETTGWTSPNNAHVDDGVYATAAPNKNAAIGTRWLNHGFDSYIPSGLNSIVKVQLIYQYKVSTTASIATMRVRAKIDGVDQANHDDTTEPTADTTITVDITADRSWTRANLLDAAYKATGEARRGNSSTGVNFSLDVIKTEVTYDITNAAGAFTLTGNDIALRADRKLSVATGSFALTGNDITLTRGYTLTVETGTFAVTGNDIGLRADRTLPVATGVFNETGQAIGLLAARLLTLATGSFIETGQPIGLVAARTVAVATGIFTLTTNDIALLADRLLSIATGVFTETGQSIGLTAARVLTLTAGSFTLTGNDITLTYAGGGYTLSISTGHYTLTLNPITLTLELRGDVKMAGVIFAPDKESVEKWRRAFPHLKKLRQILESIPNAGYRKLCIDAWARVLEDGTGTDCRVKETGMSGYVTEQTASKFDSTWANSHGGYGKMDCT